MTRIPLERRVRFGTSRKPLSGGIWSMSLKPVLGASAAVLVLAIFAGLRLIAADHTVADLAMIGDTAAIQALLAQHADINAPQADGATALHWAVYRNDSALAK